MLTETESEIDLFADELPSFEQIGQLSGVVHSSESSLMAFNKKLEEKLSTSGTKVNLAVGIGLYITGRDLEAVEKLEKGGDCKEKYICLGYVFRRLRRFEESIQSFNKSLDYGAEQLNVSLEKAETYSEASDLESCSKELEGCSKFENVSAEYHYHLGRLQEAQGLYDEATDSYQTALEISPNHQRALFHLAYRCDISGDEEAAIDYYKQIISSGPVYVNALLNLAVIYEDIDEYDKADRCVDWILEFHPNHCRAILFKKDIESSKTMYYDEEKERKKDHKHRMLETPISDFELSVRSRNCLRKMKIDTVGDLLCITEAELLSYKNFGETSLYEIKTILTSKGLRLGQSLEDSQQSSQESLVEGVESKEEDELLTRKVDELNLSVRARKCLQKLNIHALSELLRKTDAELLGCKNFGMTSLNEIKAALNNLGLSLRKLD